MRKVVITGGSGFIGSHVVELLRQSKPGWHITVIDNFSTGFRRNISSFPVEIIEGSILDQGLLNRSLDGADTVIHLAALGSVPRSVEDPVSSFQINANGTHKVLEACRKVGCTRLIFASSSSVYGSNEDIPKSEYQWLSPKSPYAASKLAAESLVSSYRLTYSMRNTSFRFFNVYGPRQDPSSPYAAVIPRLVSAVKSEKSFNVFGDGKQSRDFTFVGDVAKVLVSQLVDSQNDLPLANLAFGSSTSILQLIKISSELLGQEIAVDFKPSRIGDVKASRNSPELIMSTLGAFEPTAIREGLKMTFESHGLL